MKTPVFICSFIAMVMLSAWQWNVKNAVPADSIAAQLYADLFPNASLAPNKQVFEYAFQGANQLRTSQIATSPILAIIDFSLPSTQKRLWIVDLDQRQVLYHTLVAHGKNSGNNLAKTFSNKPQSYMSSLGFYTTANSYHGKHGLSLRLDGREAGINDKARERAIVIHGADYVSQGFINRVGRLGRSHGCPAVPVALHKEIIETLGSRSCLFIWYPDKQYLNRSALLKPSVG